MQRNAVSAGKTGARGFSLIEVALAVMIAASGLLGAFALFPASLRQSAESRADLIESTFASTVLETIAANVRQIDDIADWNDVDKWWETAIGSAFVSPPEGPVDPADFKSRYESVAAGDYMTFSLPTWEVARSYVKGTAGRREIRYYGRELTDSQIKARGTAGVKKIQEPGQWLLRLSVLKRPARSDGGLLEDVDGSAGSWLPNRYTVSIASTPDPKPESFVQNAVFSQEYFFVHRP